MKKKPLILALQIPLVSILLLISSSCNWGKTNNVPTTPIAVEKKEVKKEAVATENPAITLDTTDYNKRMLVLANKDTTGRWPVKNTPYPLAGALLPYHRIIAFYGNLYSKRMGILGELPKEEMLEKLKSETEKWQKADSTLQTIPALHYIAVTAQGSPGKGNLYRYRMPFKQIDTIIDWAKTINALVFLDIQVGHSSSKDEVLNLVPYLKLPNIHLGIDPEFSMKTGHVPGTKIGTFNAEDVNDAIAILVKVVRENKLPPKVLVVHRFTQGMLTDYKCKW